MESKANEYSRVYVVQESTRYAAGWYDHPELIEFDSAAEAKYAMKQEVKSSPSTDYSYRVIERTEIVIA